MKLDQAKQELGLAESVEADLRKSLAGAREVVDAARAAYQKDPTDKRYADVESADREAAKVRVRVDGATLAREKAQANVAAVERAEDEGLFERLLRETSMESAAKDLEPDLAALAPAFVMVAKIRTRIDEKITTHARKNEALEAVAAKLKRTLPSGRATLTANRAYAFMLRAISMAAMRGSLPEIGPVAFPRPAYDMQSLALQIARLCDNQIDATAAAERGGDSHAKRITMSVEEQMEMILLGQRHHDEIERRRQTEALEPAPLDWAKKKAQKLASAAASAMRLGGGTLRGNQAGNAVEVLEKTFSRESA